MSVNCLDGPAPHAAAQNWGEPNAGQSRASTTPPVGRRCSAGPNRKMSIRPSQNVGRIQDVAEQGHALVEHGVPPDGGIDADEDRRPHPYDDRRDGQHEGRRHAQDHVHDGTAGLRLFQVAVDQAVVPPPGTRAGSSGRPVRRRRRRCRCGCSRGPDQPPNMRRMRGCGVLGVLRAPLGEPLLLRRRRERGLLMTAPAGPAGCRPP